jgi:hypothetical protein
MGDRHNVGIRTDGHVLFIYSHWGFDSPKSGGGFLENVATALNSAKPRWNDPAYGTRIVTASLLDGTAGSALGYGITIDCLSDNEHKIPVIDWETQRVYLTEDGKKATTVVSWTFDEFVQKYA